MYTAIIFTLLGMCFGFAKRSKSDIKLPALMLLCGCAGLLFGLAFAFLLGGATEEDRVYTEEHRVEIYALADGSNISGNFFLGSGQINGHQYYYYYERLSNGGFKQKHIKVEEAVIFEHEGDSAYVSRMKGTLPEDHWAYNWTCWCACNKLYEFHVPVHSVKNNFNLDLE